jgi:hypothetical protein
MWTSAGVNGLAQDRRIWRYPQAGGRDPVCARIEARTSRTPHDSMTQRAIVTGKARAQLPPHRDPACLWNDQAGNPVVRLFGFLLG